MERRREGSAGALMLAAALILTALLAWVLWGMPEEKRGDLPESAILVYEEGGTAHG